MNRSLLDFFTRIPSSKTNSPAVTKTVAAAADEENESDKTKVEDNSFTDKMEVDNDDKDKRDSDEENLIKVKPKGKKKHLIIDSDSESNESEVKKSNAPARKGKGSLSTPSTPLQEKHKIKLNENHSASTSKLGTIDKLSKYHEDSPSAASSKKTSNLQKSNNLNSSKIQDLEFSNNEEEEEEDSQNKKWEHLSFDFLDPKKLRDIKMRSPDHPDYDPRTIHVPNSFKEKCTPAMRQWWIIKEKNFDTVLFFKVGKFYELYHMDAVVGVNELGLLYMRGNFAHSGFPEISYTRMADQLVFKGYKVARVEQTESVDAMGERTKGRPVKEKVVRRDICEISTPGVHMPSVRINEARGGAASGADLLMSASDTNDQPIDAESYALSNARCFQRFLYVLKEESIGLMSGKQSATVEDNLMMLNATFNQDGQAIPSGPSDDRLLWERQYSLAFVCVSDGTVHVGSFPDDRHSSRLRTLFTRYVPAQILFNKKCLSPYTLSMLQQSFASVCQEQITFWSAEKTLSTLAEANYFINNDGKLVWPEAIQSMLSSSDCLGLSAEPKYSHAIECIGGLVQYLRLCLVDDVVLSLKSFATYEPDDKIHFSTLDKFETENAAPFYEKQQRLVMDSITLHNLDILLNSNTGLIHGTLLERLDTCRTSFGKRKLREIVASPSCHPEKIIERQDAVEAFMNLPPGKLESVKSLLKKLPDLERLLVKIHQIGTRSPTSQHPDCNAVLYDLTNYSRRQITDFTLALAGFQTAHDIATEVRSLGLNNALINRLVVYSGEAGGEFPNMKETLNYFKEAFDHDKARKEGKIVPERGVDEDYDSSIDKIEEITREADNYLNQESRKLGFKIVYFGTARKRFQLEVAENKKVPNHYALASQRKGFRRYRTSQVDQFLSDLIAAEEMQSAALKDIMRRLFHRFSSNFTSWRIIASNMASLDCLIALADYSKSLPEPSCRPLVLPLSLNSTATVINIVDGRHPFVAETYFGCEFIPNDMKLGGSEPCVALITGPNMGGKSTLMRQTALLIVLAHIGCHVPANQCELTPVDRIFTRLGAADRILSGESTFLVEMAETACILQHASRHSLVLLDELGRGTSTYDGTALASSVLHYLTHATHLHQRCRVLFSSHYHALLDMVAAQGDVAAGLVKFGHMACLVESDEDNPEDIKEMITFLYKFTPGGCPKSYGFNAARLAHLPETVIVEGKKKAMEFEEETLMLTLLRDLTLNKLTNNQLKARQSQLLAIK